MLLKYIIARNNITKLENQRLSGNIFHLPRQRRVTAQFFNLKFNIGL